MKRRLAFSVIALLLVSLSGAAVDFPAYQTIKIREIFSQLVTRDEADRVYSGQIKSEAGLAEFRKTYGIDLGKHDVDFKKQMLVFGVTDNITTRAFQFLKQVQIRSFTLDYADTGIEHKLQRADEGKKHSYLQVFILDRTDGISHIKVRNLVWNGLSKMYDAEVPPRELTR